MANERDRALGLDRPISRRDFVQGASLGAAFAATPGAAVGSDGPVEAGYPPTLTGLRGSHPGSFEAAHAVRDGARFAAARELSESFDVVIVGAGISGLAAALYYQDRFGPDARILLLDNHDDFGGHARRNEFHQGGQMRLSLGGTHNLEQWRFSATVKRMMRRLGIDTGKLRRQSEFDYGMSAANGPAIFFDKETYGEDKLVTHFTLRWWQPGVSLDCIDEFPVSAAMKQELKSLYRTNVNVLEDRPAEEWEAYLSSISYPDFLRRHAGVSDQTVQIFANSLHGAWGLELRALSAAEAFYSGLPGLNLIGMAAEMNGFEYPVSMFPDGNASIARLMVQRLIPAVAPGANVDNIAMAAFDYAQLDRRGNPVRLRLSATVVNATHSESGVEVTYLKHGEAVRVRARHCVMACYHSILPHLCPQLPDAQKAAQKYQVKVPLVLTNVLLRSSEPLDRLGINAVACPGRMHGQMFMFKGINNGGYTHALEDRGPVPLVFWGSLTPPDDAHTVHEQLRGSRERMLALSFEDYEREVRTVLAGLLDGTGFDVAKDVLAITVNRWPHGYAYDYLQLWDPPYADGEAPHEIARQPFGRITIANSDAAASAYTHSAIDEASRAVSELPG